MINQLALAVKKTGSAIKKWKELKLFAGEWINANFKSEIDKLAHNFLMHELKAIDSSIPIISEEDNSSLVQERPSCYWIIDPIDGTCSLINGFAGFVTQVALVENNKVVLSAIYAPVLDLLFTACAGRGSFLNGKRIFCKNKTRAEILIDNYPEPRGSTKLIFEKFLLSKYMECGSISLKICKIAQGEADLFFKDVIVCDWDIAAPMLVLNEAKGCILRLDGKDFLLNGNYQHIGLVASFNLIECKKIIDFWNEKGILNNECTCSCSSSR